MARLRSPQGCPWDREQDHRSLRFHAVEEVYELIDAIEAGDDRELAEELGDLLLQVVFHCQLAQERGAFDFDQVARHIVDKLIRRHPHVFGDAIASTVEAVWTQWDQIKKAEKKGTKHERPSTLDGIPKHLPSLLRAEKLLKKARKARLVDEAPAGRCLATPGRSWEGSCLAWSNMRSRRDGPPRSCCERKSKKPSAACAGANKKKRTSRSTQQAGLLSSERRSPSCAGASRSTNQTCLLSSLTQNYD